MKVLKTDSSSNEICAFDDKSKVSTIPNFSSEDPKVSYYSPKTALANMREPKRKRSSIDKG